MVPAGILTVSRQARNGSGLPSRARTCAQVDAVVVEGSAVDGEGAVPGSVQDDPAGADVGGRGKFLHGQERGGQRDRGQVCGDVDAGQRAVGALLAAVAVDGVRHNTQCQAARCGGCHQYLGALPWREEDLGERDGPLD